MFVNREQELAFLEERYRSGRAELIVLSGRRRTGKTTLLSRFCTGGESGREKPHIFFMGDFGSETMLRQRLSSALLAFETGAGDVESFAFQTWEAAFEHMAYLARERRVVVVLDEFPYLIRVNAGIPSILQRVWDQSLRHTQIMLILCGSNLSIMRQDVLAYRSPLYGRHTGQWFVKPLLPWDAGRLFPNYNATQRLEAYAVLGGIPAYLEQFDDQRSVMVNIERHLLRPGAMLYEEPRALLASELELREPATYYAILRAIAAGQRGSTSIARAIGKPAATYVQRHLEVLSNGLQLIRRHVSLGPRPPEPRARGRWQFADPFFAFWFAFVYPHTSLLERGAAQTVMADHVRPRWPAFVGRGAWETACREHIWRLAASGQLGFQPEKVGRWWSAQAEIDLVAVNYAEKRALLGEAKWMAKKVGMPDLAGLEQKRTAWLASVPQEDWDVMYALFGRDFTADLLATARQHDHILLFTVDDVMSAS